MGKITAFIVLQIRLSVCPMPTGSSAMEGRIEGSDSVEIFT